MTAALLAVHVTLTHVALALALSLSVAASAAAAATALKNSEIIFCAVSYWVSHYILQKDFIFQDFFPYI
jgi:hypothetical protein